MNLEPLSVQDVTLRRLRSWTRRVAEDATDADATWVNRDDINSLCRVLDRWADFLAAHELAEYAVKEISQDARACENIALDIRRRRFEVGRCIGHVENDEGEQLACDGTLSALFDNRDDLLPVLTCDTRPDHVWDGSQWGEISRMPVTVEDAARITRIPARTIRQWIEDGRIGTVASSRPMLVRLSDVTRSGVEKVS
jgi:excisionase family DNA binding protein